MALRPAARVIDILKFAPKMLEHVNEQDRSIFEAMLARFDIVELRIDSSSSADFVVVARTLHNMEYSNPMTGVTAILPAQTMFGYQLRRYGRDDCYQATHGINRVSNYTEFRYSFFAWDCTDTYIRGERTTHPQYASVIASLAQIDLLLMHATNQDGFDGHISTAAAMSMYREGWGMSFRDVVDTADRTPGYTCSECNERMTPGETFWAFDAPYCESCYDNYYTTCFECDRIVNREEAVYFDHIGYACDAHTYECEWCESNTHMLHGFGEYLICPRCMDCLVACQDCGTVMDPENAVIGFSNPGDTRCLPCHVNWSMAAAIIDDESFVPRVVETQPEVEANVEPSILVESFTQTDGTEITFDYRVEDTADVLFLLTVKPATEPDETVDVALLDENLEVF
jgi:hypothetical protein